jgi:hypothetical protein
METFSKVYVMFQAVCSWGVVVLDVLPVEGKQGVNERGYYNHKIHENERENLDSQILHGAVVCTFFNNHCCQP